MSEGNKVIVHRYFEEILDGGNLDLVDEIFDPEYVLHDPKCGRRGART
jgi:hypothetical protein